MSSATTDSTAQRQRAFRTYVEPEIEVELRVAQTLTGPWADSEDLVPDTLIQAYRAIEGFDGAHPRAWLLTILRHTATDQLLDDNVETALAALDPKSRTVLLPIGSTSSATPRWPTCSTSRSGTVMSRLSRARGRVRADLRSNPEFRRSR